MLRFHFPIGARLKRLTDDPTRRQSHQKRRPRKALRLAVEPLEARALLAMATVNVLNDSFNQPAVTIHLGDTVQWVWIGSDHSTTAVAGSVESWDSGVHNAGFTFSHTFTHVGSFAYYCVIHGFDKGNGTAGGMAGMVTVASASATLQSIAVTPADPIVPVGGTEQFIAVGNFSDGSTQNLTNQVTWGSLTPSVATVSNMGLASSLSTGATAITASFGSLFGATVLTVATPTPSPTPVLTGEMRMFAGKGARRKVVGFDLMFSAALDAGVAQNISHYHVTQPGATRRARPVVVRVKSASFNPADDTLMLMLGAFNAKKALTLTATGLIGATGMPVTAIVTKL
jgi:plastocyanin